MKKKLASCVEALLIGIAVYTVGWGCSGNKELTSSSGEYVTIKKNIQDISSVVTSSSIDIVFYQRNGTPSVEIHAPEEIANHVVVDDSNGRLNVHFENSFRQTFNGDVIVTVYAPSLASAYTLSSGNIRIPKGIYTEGRLEMETRASGDIKCGDVQCYELVCSTQGSGDVEIDKASCQSATLDIKASGDCDIEQLDCSGKLTASVKASGDLSVSGTAVSAFYRVAGSGDLEASALKADSVEATDTASGDLHCHALKSLVAVSRGTGTLYYSGTPQQFKADGKRIDKR